MGIGPAIAWRADANQDRYLELYLAVAWAGAVIVPVNIRWSPAEIEDSLRDCRPMALVEDDAFAELGGKLAHSIESLRLIHADDGATPAGAASYEALVEAASPVPDAMRGANDLAGIFYTGGTTGRSKGVMLSNRNLMANASTCWPRGCFRAIRSICMRRRSPGGTSAPHADRSSCPETAPRPAR